jgi:hypothetical protein
MLKAYFLRKVLLVFFMFTVVIPGGISCVKQNTNTVKVVKPKGRKKPYNPKKHKRSKRTKKVKMNN